MGMFGKSCNSGYSSCLSGFPFKKSCSGGYSIPARPAPDPSPTRWKLLAKYEYANGYVLKVHYFDCTNFEGVKVMVYRGEFNESKLLYLDPHFTNGDNSPIARFPPTDAGIEMAKTIARRL